VVVVNHPRYNRYSPPPKNPLRQLFQNRADDKELKHMGVISLSPGRQEHILGSGHPKRVIWFLA
jgi:hypothetical protein